MKGTLLFFRTDKVVGNSLRIGVVARGGNTALLFLAGALLMIARPAAAQTPNLPWLMCPSPFEGAATARMVFEPTDFALGAIGTDDAPDPQAAAPPANPPNPPAAAAPTASLGNGFGVLAFLPPPINQKRLTPKDKFQIYVHQNYGPQNFILPAFSAAFLMLHPPSGYPREWEDGGGAFGRWYGDEFVSSTVNRTARLAAQIALREDPRYVPSGSRNLVVRLGHALVFTLIDKTDSGHNTLALSNFVGAAAGGFMGMSFLPPGHNDVTHAEQRSLRGLETIAVRNIVTEFRPQWEPTLRRIHIPSVLPEWWTRQHSRQP